MVSIFRMWFENLLTILGMRASVESVMRSPPVTASLYEPVSSVVEKMVSNKIGAVIVMSGDAHAGMITERDTVERVMWANKDPKETLAKDVMSSPLISIESNMRVRDALTLMRDKKMRRLAVTRKGRLIGLVTVRRLLDSLV